MIFVPPAFASDAILEASDAGIELIICITEGIPISDMVEVYRYIKVSESRLIGPTPSSSRKTSRHMQLDIIVIAT